MSNIKVRAWDAEKKKMHYPSIISTIRGDSFSWDHRRSHLHDCMEWSNEDGFVWNPTVMLSTGLRDQTLNEIYDRDIIRTDGGVILEVRWQNDSAAFVAVSNGSSHIHYFGRGINPDYVEVIGNIYENQELLNPAT